MQGQHATLLAAVAACLALGSALPSPATSLQEGSTGLKANSFWKGTPMDAVVGELEAECANNDAVACIKFRVLNVLDQVFRKDSVQVTDSVSVVRNSYEEVEAQDEQSGRASDLLDAATHYMKRHDVLLQLPFGAKASLSPRSLDNDQLDIKLDFSGDSSSEAAEARHRRRKGKLRKLMVPIMVFILLKAMTLIPLAIGVLGLKAWNALQLGFFSFVISVALAIFQLCKKIAADSAPVSQLSTHVGPAWDAHYAAARALELQPAAGAGAGAGAGSPQDLQAHSLAYRGH